MPEATYEGGVVLVPSKIWQEIERILKRGNTAEIKKEKGQFVVVEIKRTATVKVMID